MPQRNLAVELLEKLLKGELATRRRKNVVQACQSALKSIQETASKMTQGIRRISFAV
jgi:hypothetical protein